MQIQTPPTIITTEDDSDDEYEQWVDDEIKRFQFVLREIEEVEEGLRRMKDVGSSVARTRKWIEGIWKEMLIDGETD